MSVPRRPGWDSPNNVTEEPNTPFVPFPIDVSSGRFEFEQDHVESRRLNGYIEPPALSDIQLSDMFPYIHPWIESHDPYVYRNAYGRIATGWANKLMYVCHNCGITSYKLSDDTHETFKCPSCRSRNLTVLRSGEISLLVRGSGVGLNMQEVYNERRQRIRRQRTERSAARGNTQRET